MRNMTNEEHDNFKKVVKCNWRKCGGSMGLAGNGCCSFRGEWNNLDCPEFVSDDDYEKELDNEI